MEDDACADSSFLVSHHADTNHAAASALMAKAALTLAFTPLHRVEVHGASRNAKANGEVTAADCRLAFRQIEEDLHDAARFFLGHLSLPLHKNSCLIQ